MLRIARGQDARWRLGNESRGEDAGTEKNRGKVVNTLKNTFRRNRMESLRYRELRNAGTH